MKTVRDILPQAVEFLKKHSIDAATRTAQEAIGSCLGFSRLQLVCNLDYPLSDDELAQARKVLADVAKGVPFAYACGFVDFLGCRIAVSPVCLIPRQETEILASMIVAELKDVDCRGKILWDLCTGSGCLAIAIKKALPELVVHASDISEEALALAAKNAEANGVAVQFHRGDFTGAIDRKIDYLVSNPPYISDNEMKELDASVRDFEPHLALRADSNGLAFYERLAKAPLGACKIWLEMGHAQGESLSLLFKQAAGKVVKDWAGHDRFFIVELQ